MCGICGKLNFDRHEPVDLDLIGRMTDTIIHRGPDGGGQHVFGPVGLGHRRLSIIDLNTGAQPMSNEDGSVWIVFNGEIYNFQELRPNLEARGHKFKSATDTEVIIHLYEEYGPESITKLQGMFAFALWDEKKQLLLLARDRVGIKPLYYINTGKSLLFGSEIKSIIADSGVPRDINPRAIDRFFTYGYLPGRETLLKGIYKLEPGHYLTACEGKIVDREYWDLRFQVDPGRTNFNDVVEELRDLLRKTVKSHMISDVPVGVLLSGGVDSSGILRYAVEQTDKPIHTFTVGFAGEEFADERPYARLAAKRFGTEHHEITMSAENFLDFLPKYAWHMEEPVFEPPAVALYYVSRLARDSGVKVLLSGEGGDEAFGGYPNYRNLLLLERLKTLFGPAKDLLRLGLRTLGGAGWYRFGKYAGLVDRPLSAYYLSRTATPDSELIRLKSSLYTSEFAETLSTERSDQPTHSLFSKLDNSSHLDAMLYLDTKTWLPDDLLIKADKMTMATSVELRVPLLDFQVLEFAASLPTDFKVRGWETKRILKYALRNSIPHEIVNRKKTGFPVPYDRWLRTRGESLLSEALLARNALINSYFSSNKTAEFLRPGGLAKVHPKAVFCLLMLEFLFRTFNVRAR
ncbi:MAG: asparagine synthase (glutamine-hydrolyzing) [Syntrophobacteraceae bacterium]